jgi:hypothetical protein
MQVLFPKRYSWSKSDALKSENKNNVILSVGNVHRVQRWMHSRFSSCLMQAGEEFLQWRLKCTAQYFVSILLMCAGCFCTRSPTRTPKDRNPVTIDPGIEGGHKFWEIMRPPKNSLYICIVEFAISTVAPSCWDQQPCSSTSEREIKFKINSW